MIQKPLYTSLTRISDLEHGAYDVTPMERETWATGDYVIGEVVSRINLLDAATNRELCELLCQTLGLDAPPTAARG